MSSTYGSPSASRRLLHNALAIGQTVTVSDADLEPSAIHADAGAAE
jgi:hypothetical protein